jgi:hypothetical protein
MKEFILYVAGSRDATADQTSATALVFLLFCVADAASLVVSLEQRLCGLIPELCLYLGGVSLSR